MNPEVPKSIKPDHIEPDPQTFTSRSFVPLYFITPILEMAAPSLDARVDAAGDKQAQHVLRSRATGHCRERPQLHTQVAVVLGLLPSVDTAA